MRCFTALVFLFVSAVDTKLKSCGNKGGLDACDDEWKAVKQERHDLTVPAEASIEEYCKTTMAICSAASSVVICLANYRRVCNTSLDSPTLESVRSLPHPSTGSDRVDRAVKGSQHEECIRLRVLLEEFKYFESSNATKGQS